MSSADLFNRSLQFMFSINCCKTHTKQMSSRTSIREKFKALDRNANDDEYTIMNSGRFVNGLCIVGNSKPPGPS